MESLRICLMSLTHSLPDDDCVDHFMSSAYSMKILELCATEHSGLLPLVLQVGHLKDIESFYGQGYTVVVTVLL